MITDILEKLKTTPSEQIESEVVEFKSYSSENAFHNGNVADEICALANNSGGLIIVGVVDSSNIKENKWNSQLKGFSKIDLDTAKERLLGRLSSKIPLTLTETDFEKKNYLIIEVPNITHALVTTSAGKVYLREGKSSVPATPDQIQQLVKSLQSYDWSGDENDLNIIDSLDAVVLQEAKADFCNRRKIDASEMTDEGFLEAIDATKNGRLNNSGLLFLGKKEVIKKRLGLFEYRFSWKTANGELLINEVWDECIWNSVKRVKEFFKRCNRVITISYQGANYELNILDEQAFHEAFLNAIVHRDYAIDGMTSVNFMEHELIITNPGTFYGGVTSSNISYHQPRHRNKALAKTLMAFQLVDRAGMGILRIGLNSLMYGRDFPVWQENLQNIEIRMPAEYFKAEVFILTQNYIKKCNLSDLYIINNLYKTGHVSVSALEKQLGKILQKPWQEIEKSMAREEMKELFTYHGNNDGVFICTTKKGIISLGVAKAFRTAANSEKHVRLYLYLRQHKSATNEEIRDALGFKFASSTSQFLKNLNYVKNSGKARKSSWSLK
ncbi:MAG: putative DNA binding domain-containing protein [Flavobacterium sp.]|nr:putative DNA binding domain-containing protein [Flavobacterium sp.]